MKKIILSFIILISVAKAQNLYIDVIDLTTGTKKIVPYIPGVTISKAYIDSAVSNKALQSFVNTSFTNLQTWATNTFALKGAGGTASVSAPLNLTAGDYFVNLLPPNYGVSYPSLSSINPIRKAPKFSIIVSPGDNGGDGAVYGDGKGMPDNVFSAGINLNHAGGQLDLNHASQRIWSQEGNYFIPGFGLAFEDHWGLMYDERHIEHRPASTYSRQLDGRSFMQSEVFNHQYNVKTLSNTVIPYYNIESQNDDGDGLGTFAQVTMLAGSKANSGGKYKWNHNGLVSSLEGNGGGVLINSSAGQSAYWDRLGNVFMGYLSGTTVFLGNEYDNRFIDRTKKLQVRGDALIEGTINGYTITKDTDGSPLFIFNGVKYGLVKK